MNGILDLGVRELLKAFSGKTVSPSDYMAAVCERVEACEPKVGALYDYRPEQAMKQAEEATQRWLKGTPNGALDGVPVTLKELIATKGDPVPMGTAATELVPADADAPTAARLKEDGAIIFAKTTCPDYGMLSSGLSTFHQLSRNPWDLSTNPGGSSAGAGSAGAAGYGPLHIGTDIGGSVRLPAGWTGLFGFKPTQGRVPVYPYYPGRCVGPMTRTVDDSLMVMPVITRPDWHDATSVPYEALDYDVAPANVKGMKIGLILDAGTGLKVDPEVHDAVLAAARMFEEQGADIVELGPLLTRENLDGLDTFWRARFWSQMRKLGDEARGKILPYILDWASAAAKIDGASVAAGFDHMLAMRQSCASALNGVSAILSPVNPIVSFPAEWPAPTNDPALPFEHICFTMPWNMGDQPACSINCGFSKSGMPIGLQIIAPRFEDLTVLSLAKAFEEWRGPITNWPVIAS